LHISTQQVIIYRDDGVKPPAKQPMKTQTAGELYAETRFLFLFIIVPGRAFGRTDPSSAVRRPDDERGGPHLRRGCAVLDVADARESGDG
jgi:hypothetical protein